MNVFATFEAASLKYGLSKYDDVPTVKVAITLVLQWLLAAVHHRRSPDSVINNVHGIIKDTYPYAEYMLRDNTVIDNRTGHTSAPVYPSVHSADDKKYYYGEYSTIHNSLYCRYSEIVEHLVLNYTHPVMGFFFTLEQDKHATSVQCLEYTDSYISAIIHCRNLIEYDRKSKDHTV